ncbi:MAG: hypothetical protein GW898_03090 [Thiomicrospira sp.]|nr:hypothetical protein [Thiomicrospira sp.]NCO13352.1 hypothetical protein [Thiomicrospira sp.]NCO81683.1 hypothetical protein [Thiomicrospira sp.]
MDAIVLIVLIGGLISINGNAFSKIDRGQKIGQALFCALAALDLLTLGFGLLS